MRTDASARAKRAHNPYLIQFTPLVAHIVYILDILLWTGISWGAVQLSIKMNIGGNGRYFVLLAPIAAIAGYVRHCLIKKDYLFQFIPFG